MAPLIECPYICAYVLCPLSFVVATHIAGIFARLWFGIHLLSFGLGQVLQFFEERNLRALEAAAAVINQLICETQLAKSRRSKVWLRLAGKQLSGLNVMAASARGLNRRKDSAHHTHTRINNNLRGACIRGKLTSIRLKHNTSNTHTIAISENPITLMTFAVSEHPDCLCV